MDRNYRIEEALFRGLVENAAIPLVGSAIGCVLVSVVQWQSNSHRIVIGWVCLVLAVIGARIWLTLRCRATLAAGDYQRSQAVRYAGTTSLSGLVWGACGLFVAGADPVALVVTITAVLAMAMGGVLTLAAFMPAFLAFVFPAVLPMVIVLAVTGGAGGVVLALYSFIFMLLLIGIAHRFNREMRQTWQLTFEKEDLVSAVTEAHDRLALLADTDSLTKLANRRRFDEVLSKESVRANRTGQSLALLMLDIDHFKLFNDRYGHQAGDECLAGVAAVLQAAAQRAGDLAARYGGEEFVLIFPGIDAATARRLAESIRHSIEMLAIPTGGAHTAKVTVSIGVATTVSTADGKAESLLHEADKALYCAKNAGRNQTWVAAPLRQNGDTGKNGSRSFVQLVWHPAFECGHATIDDQHRGLFRQANALLSAVISGHQAEDLADQINGLIRDVGQHFQDEEAVIAAAGYAGAEDHAAVHRGLKDGAVALVEQFHAGTLDPGALFQFLAHDIIAAHMLGADRDFFPCLSDGRGRP